MAISSEGHEGTSSHHQHGRKWRLFVGNLAETVKQDELREKFELLLRDKGGDKQDVKIGNTEIRCKNEDNYFGFVDVHSNYSEGGDDRPPSSLEKVIQLMNNTKWKGTLIKVQLAKESFLDKLKRERGSQDDSKTNSVAAPPKKTYNERPRFVPTKKPDNFDFEIVPDSVASKGKAIVGAGDNIGGNIGDEAEDEEEEDNFHEEGIPRFKGLASFGFGNNVGIQQDLQLLDCGIQKPLPVIEKKLVGKSNDKKEENEQVQISDEDKARFERFQRIAGYPVTTPKTQVPKKFDTTTSNSINDHQPIYKAAKVDQETDNNSEIVTKGVVFRKHKQQNSDLLRQQSLNKMKDVKVQQHNIIKSSLAQENIKNSFEDDTTNSFNKKSRKRKIDLFNDNDGEGDDNNFEDFNVKKQYEGAEGQRLLELRGRWAFDDRFKIDERFKENDANENLPAEDEEKQKQMSILSDVLGTTMTLQPKPISSLDSKKKNRTEQQSNSNSVLVQRYDPDSVDTEIEIEPTRNKKKAAKELKQSTTASAKVTTTTEEAPAPIRSTEPATYKTASNLKALFSSEDTTNQQTKTNSTNSGFSLLATFGDADVGMNNTDNNSKMTSSATAVGAPRQFWESNPFKYDSSDDEDDDKDKMKKKKVNPIPITIPKCEFFFRKNDPRFSGLEDYFMKKDKMEERIEDYDEKRRELRSIVKAKARNAKRKDEKRTLAIKRAIRKKKKYRKTLGKATSVNSVQLGGS